LSADTCDKLAIRNAWTTRAAQRHVVVSLVALGRIVVEIESRERFAEHAGKFGDVFVEGGTGSSQRIAISLAPSPSKS
jgi:hypothetical protein